jgi:histidinol-phosphate aminotransferase
MACDFLPLAKKGVQGLQPYQPGKPIDELKRELGLTEVVKLASNENPLGLSKRVKKVLADNLDSLTRYPDGAGFELKAALSKKLGVQSNQIVLGNGSNDVLDLIGLCFLSETTSAVFSQYAFVVYPIMVQYLGAKAIVTPAKQWGHDLDAMLAAVQVDTRVVFIANPNNPTGTWLEHDELRNFMLLVREDVIVVLDEAYTEYNKSGCVADGIALQKEFSNLIVVRTFSKAYGLAGLRVGYSVSTPELANIINRVREPFNVSSLGQMAAVEVLNDAEYLAESVRVNDEGRKQLEAGFVELGIEFIPSQGNFITFDTKQDAMQVYQKLLAKGVIVRPIVPYGMPNHLRVSIGLEAENAFFLKALRQVFA